MRRTPNKNHHIYIVYYQYIPQDPWIAYSPTNLPQNPPFHLLYHNMFIYSCKSYQQKYQNLHWKTRSFLYKCNNFDFENSPPEKNSRKFGGFPSWIRSNPHHVLEPRWSNPHRGFSCRVNEQKGRNLNVTGRRSNRSTAK